VTAVADSLRTSIVHALIWSATVPESTYQREDYRRTFIEKGDHGLNKTLVDASRLTLHGVLLPREKSVWVLDDLCRRDCPAALACVHSLQA
jgi:hypothetical protein